MRPVNTISIAFGCDGAGQPLRAAAAGDDPQGDFRLAEFGIIGGQDEVAHHRHFAAPPPEQ